MEERLRPCLSVISLRTASPSHAFLGTETFRDHVMSIGDMGRPYGNRRLNKPFKWHLARSGERDRANEHPFTPILSM